jgi:hypothetical protein
MEPRSQCRLGFLRGTVGPPGQESASRRADLTIEETAQANAAAAVGTTVGSQTKLDRELDSARALDCLRQSL